MGINAELNDGAPSPEEFFFEVTVIGTDVTAVSFTPAGGPLICSNSTQNGVSPNP